MLYSLKKETGQERPKDKSTNKNKKSYDIIPTPCPPPTIWYEWTPLPPHLIINFKIIRFGSMSCIRIFSVKEDHLTDGSKHETLSLVAIFSNMP